MKVKVKTVRNVFFYIAYMFFLSFSTFGHIPVLGGYLKALTNLGIIILIAIFLASLHQYKIKELQVFLLLFVFSFVLIGTANYYGLFKLSLLIATSKGIEFRKCIKYDLITRMVMIAVMVVLFFMGIAPDVTSSYNGTLRHSMGFENPNHVGLMAFIIIMEIVYLSKAKLNLSNYLVAIMLIVLADVTAGSRTAELMTIMALLFVSIYKFFPKIFDKRLMKRLMKYCPILCGGITFISSYLYSSGNMLAILINQIFSGRLANIIYYQQKYGLSLFGVDTSTAGRTNDNLYGYCLIGLGVITFIIFLIFYIKMIDNVYDKNKPIAIILTCFMIYGLSERLWMNVDYNIIMLAFRDLVYHDLEKDIDTISNRKKILKLKFRLR